MERKTDLVFMIPDLRLNDAMGNDLWVQYKTLENAGYSVAIYCSNCDTQLDFCRASREQVMEAAILLYHHGTLWGEGGELYAASSAVVKLLRSHNVTPPVFFEPYAPQVADRLEKATRQSEFLIKHSSGLLSASEFNNKCLHELCPNSLQEQVFPPFMPNLDVVARQAEKQKRSRKYVIGIGRIAPNKGVHHFLRTAAIYRELYGDNLDFFWVGRSSADTILYKLELEILKEELELEDSMFFLEDIEDPSQLISWLKGAEAFFLPSEHEGFGVPLIEAQAAGTPVLTFDRAAIKETIGLNQLAMEKVDLHEAACAIRVIIDNPEVAAFLVEQGYQNIQKQFNQDELKKKFVEYIMQYLPGRKENDISH